MIFVKTEKLREGMRLAKPIYNKKGVLLYERDSHLSKQGMESIKNFGLIGIYVLEPAEPCPPMSEEDIEFERFQTMAFFKLDECLTHMLKDGKPLHLRDFADEIVSKYGRLDHKITFQQSLRSGDDYIQKHSLNVALLCALLTRKLQFRTEEQIECIMAALVHEVGKLQIPPDVKKNMTPENAKETERKYEHGGFSLIENQFFSAPQIKRMVSHAFSLRDAIEKGEDITHMKLVAGGKILAAADAFDVMTAMNDKEEPATLLGALKILQNKQDYYGKDVIKAFIDSLNFLPEGSSVELTNGEKGLVISANDYDIFRPVVLTYHSNKLIDLRNTGRGGLEILDIVKKFDARHVIDRDTLQAAKESL
ncbi:MAG: HD domain-containing protein [Lachnospiraceae bacterium]|nr:HD domain-containing protein [Lachnospiraceae bacterium]